MIDFHRRKNTLCTGYHRCRHGLILCFDRCKSVFLVDISSLHYKLIQLACGVFSDKQMKIGAVFAQIQVSHRKPKFENNE